MSPPLPCKVTLRPVTMLLVWIVRVCLPVAIPPPVGVVIVMLPESGSGPVASDMEMEIMLGSVLLLVLLSVGLVLEFVWLVDSAAFVRVLV